MSDGYCGRCKAGQYLCPSDQQTCVDSAADYVDCPKVTGTHLDWKLDIETRLDYLVAHTDLDTQVNQLQNTAPSIDELGIPQYQWLNDDQHGVARTTARATAFPNGCGLGAGWNKETLRQVGQVLAEEARGLHNGFLHNTSHSQDYDPRNPDCNGCGISLYAPNLNLVRDPRWGRAQEVFGEDPTHMSDLVVPFVTGAQDFTPKSTSDNSATLRVGMCCKHFAVYDSEGGTGLVVIHGGVSFCLSETKQCCCVVHLNGTDLFPGE